MTFRVGMKVVCVDNSDHYSGRWGADRPALNVVYTVVRCFRLECGDCVELLEIKNIEKFDCGYNASRFRPVVERKTDISIFTAMLSPSQVTVDAMNIADCGREMVR